MNSRSITVSIHTVKRLRRILFNTLTAISLLLAISTAGLWVQSYWACDSVTAHRSNQVGGKEVGIFSFKGRLLFLSLGRDDLWPAAAGWKWDRQPASNPRLDSSMSTRHHFAGFGYTHWGHRTNRFFVLTVPHAALFIPVVAMSILRWRQDVRRLLLERPTHCPACGYDTRANPAKCSECGHAFETLPDRC